MVDHRHLVTITVNSHDAAEPLSHFSPPWILRSCGLINQGVVAAGEVREVVSCSESSDAAWSLG